MEVTFVLDNRERALLGLLTAADAVATENLQLGDFQIRRKEDGAPILIVERKTIPDLVASLRDGRYREQKARLLASGCKAAMVLEGGVEYQDAGGNKAIVGCIVNSALRDGIHVFVTQTPEETVGLLRGLMSRYATDAQRYAAAPAGGTAALPAAADADSYLSTRCIKSKRCDNIDEEACFVMQLCAIPGISSKKAQAIVGTLGVHNMGELVRALTALPKALEAVPGVGKQLSITVCKFLMGSAAAEAAAAKVVASKGKTKTKTETKTTTNTKAKKGKSTEMVVAQATTVEEEVQVE